MGNEAFAHAALEAGVRLFAGYPGTPSSELIETVAKLRAQGRAKGIHVEWSTNEKAALEVAAAAAMSGDRALFTCKQVGLNVASDALMSLNYVGVRGGLVLFVADDPGPISSQTEQDTRVFAAFAKVPVFDPSTPEEGYLMMKAAFELSERYGTPVIVRPTTRIDHASTFINVADETEARVSDGFKRDPQKFVIFPKRSYEAHKEINERLVKIAADFSHDEEFARFNYAYERDAQTGRANATEQRGAATQTSGTPKLGVVCGGDSAAYAREALDVLAEEAARQGACVPSYKFMQVGTPYPVPEDALAEFLQGIHHVLVLEELDPFLEKALRELAGVKGLQVKVHGKLTGEASAAGENSAEDALIRVATFFDAYGDTPDETNSNTKPSDIACALTNPDALYSYKDELPPRPPNLCAGCPHRGSFYAVKRALRALGVKRDDAVFCGDIGCYTLGNAAPLDAVDTCLCMGAGITMAQGFSAVNSDKKTIAFVGDSTFFASGLTGVVNAVYNNHDVTICVLDNSTTAMTGMQPHPGTGVTLMGTRSKPVDIAGMLKAAGINGEALVFADPLDLDQAQAACEKALGQEGPSAIIFQSPCIWLERHNASAKVNPDVCTGCKKCITEIGCPAVSFDLDACGSKSGKRGQARIDRAQCTGCALCAQVCPFEAIEIFEPKGADAR